jgi:hypothetical protein
VTGHALVRRGPEDVLCMRHCRWTTGEHQPGLADQPEVLAAHRAYRRMARAHGLFGTMTYQMAPRLEFRWRMVSVACFGLLGGLIVALLSGSTGFGAVHAPSVGITAIGAMMAAAAGLATMVFVRLVGSVGLSLASVVLLTLGNSTSGGTMPAQYLPGWLRPLSEILPVGVGVRAIQGTAYFHNEGLARGIAVLAVWIVVCAGILYARDVLAKRWAAA